MEWRGEYREGSQEILQLKMGSHVQFQELNGGRGQKIVYHKKEILQETDVEKSIFLYWY